MLPELIVQLAGDPAAFASCASTIRPIISLRA